MISLFKPSDFYRTGINETACVEMSGVANEVLNEYLEREGVKVTGLSAEGYGWFGPPFNRDSDTHSALLINIQEIKKAKCENHGDTHWPNRLLDHNIQTNTFTCSCGAKLKAKWELAE